jgi:NitT/TauT family transport system substrate-binding protein
MAGVVAIAVAGCSSSSPAQKMRAAVAHQHRQQVLVEEGRGPVVRLGLMVSAADASGLAGVRMGYFGQQLGGGVSLHVVPFGSGAGEAAALEAGQLDAAYVDPVAAVAAWQATGGKLRIVAGAGLGGAELVAGRAVRDAGNLAGKVVAAPAGTGEAGALVSWLHGRGVAWRAPTGGVTASGAAAVAAFRAGQLAGAWEPAPFDEEMVAAGGHVLVDEAALWPSGRFASAVLVVRAQFLAAHPAQAEALLKGQVQANDMMNTDRAAGLSAAGAELVSLLGAPVATGVLAESFAQVTFTNDPAASSVLAEARQAAAAGEVRQVRSLAGLWDLGPLNHLLRAAGQSAVSG